MGFTIFLGMLMGCPRDVQVQAARTPGTPTEDRGTRHRQHEAPTQRALGTRVGKGHPSGDTAGPESAGERPWEASGEHTWFPCPDGPEQTPLSESSVSALEVAVSLWDAVCRNLNVPLGQGRKEQDALLGAQQSPGPPPTCSRAGHVGPSHLHL